MSRRLSVAEEAPSGSTWVGLFDGDIGGFYEFFPEAESVRSIFQWLQEIEWTLDAEPFLNRVHQLTEGVPGLCLPDPAESLCHGLESVFDWFEGVEATGRDYDGAGPGCSGRTTVVRIRLAKLERFLVASRAVEDAVGLAAHELVDEELRDDLPSLPEDLQAPWDPRDEQRLLSRRAEVRRKGAKGLPVHVLRRQFLAQRLRPTVRESILLELARRGAEESGVVADAIRARSRRVRFAGLVAAKALGRSAGPLVTLIAAATRDAEPEFAERAESLRRILEQEHGLGLPGDAAWRKLAALCPPEWSHRLPRPGEDLVVPGPLGLVPGEGS